MLLRQNLSLWIVFSLLFLGRLQAEVVPTKSAGKKVFDDIKELLVRVKAADSLASPKSSYGTGYAINAEGILATNYHVISDFVMQPGNQWKIIVETNNEQNMEAELLGFSVVDDLAIIRVKQKFPRALKIAKQDPTKGERSYSLGLPNDINMSLIEGVYNGILEYGPYQIVHVTTPLNGGMSGGPTVNSDGELVGTNVARILFANDISFIVPKARLERLMDHLKISTLQDKVSNKALTKKEAQKSLYTQLEESQKKLAESVLAGPTQKVEIWKDKVIELPKYLKCWSEGTEEPQLPYVSKTRSCRLEHALFLAQGLETGSFDISVKMLDASKVNRFSTEMLMGDVFNPKAYLGSFFEGQKFGDLDAREIFTPYECKHGFMDSKLWSQNKKLRSSMCLRRYKESQNLYDFSFQLVDFSGLLKTKVEVVHSGIGLEESKKLLAYWMERFQ